MIINMCSFLLRNVVRDIYEFESPRGVVISVGGQVPNNLAIPLAKHGLRLLGTSAASIARAENRSHFSAMLDDLCIGECSGAAIR
jgi:carbamoyl-phosphate synthase large subunit